MKRVELWTDGSCSGNPGPGGWAALLRLIDGDQVKEKMLGGYVEYTTNNRMEMMAVIAGLEALRRPCYVAVYLDSEYVAKTIMHRWAKKKNADLWDRLSKAMLGHQIMWNVVKGHSGIALNERVDALAWKFSQYRTTKLENVSDEELLAVFPGSEVEHVRRYADA